MSTLSKLTLLPEVEKFLSRGRLTSFVGGQSFESGSSDVITTYDPGSGEKLADVEELTSQEVDQAVQVADEAFKKTGWATMPVNERAALIHRLADAIEKKVAILGQIESLDAGKVEAQAQGDVQNCADTLRYFADLSQHLNHRTTLAVKGHEAWTIRKPWGACAFIFPWNFPILLIGWGIAPALAAGNTVVIKPAEDTPLSAIYLAELAKEVGIPDGVINVITGRGATVGAALSNNKLIKRMSFTGSPEVGRLVGQSCGHNLVPVKLELGGKGAAVIFDDVDVADTAEKLAAAITFHSGQVCCDATRWIVQQDIYDEFVNQCVDRLSEVKIGHQLEADTQMGPVVNAKQRERVLGYLEKGVAEGAECVLSGGPAQVAGYEGHFVKPALLSGSLGNTAAQQEIFGPVAYLASFKTEQEAIEMANYTTYGLANSVWTADLARAGRVAESMVAGNSWINAHNVFAQGVPYGGINQSGLGGGVLSVETLLDYYRSTSVVRPL
ncbi:aldehyde dehydrogenase family protein [Bremerella alba]|uniref:Phenylacetaldehyde dehydrogenase n=1 Tax=Bremerella alba TaxID=980252 RepID=A0A7V9A7A5_9BACT|nr:aldehyde dehydrogenase family protein [Bremerella alba]MBA2115220.1 Phenylacetaldehyde dehydrogenase [Bremerella alba]